jgi:purine nucleosidase
MKEEGPLYIACMGAITNVASAILMEPAILKKDIKIIWIGGGDYPDGRWEYNLKNDINAATIPLISRDCDNTACAMAN